MRGRSLLWYGLAQHIQSIPQAVDSLLQALEYESTYGGQSLWLCHYALGIAHPDSKQAAHHRNRARQMLEGVATSLYRRPVLTKAVRDHDRIAGVFRHLTDDA